MTAAMELFRKRGFEETTMRDIAVAAGVALGGAYYYYESKQALVMAFYQTAQREMETELQGALTGSKDLEKRLHAMFQVKFNYFAQDRALLGALSAHTDPGHPLSPFSAQTACIRDHDVELFRQAIAGSTIRVSADLEPYLPRVLWLFQMGLILFWVYDSSPGQTRTKNLVERSVRIVLNLIRFSTLPLMRPVRKQAVELLLGVYAEQRGSRL